MQMVKAGSREHVGVPSLRHSDHEWAEPSRAAGAASTLRRPLTRRTPGLYMSVLAVTSMIGRGEGSMANTSALRYEVVEGWEQLPAGYAAP